MRIFIIILTFLAVNSVFAQSSFAEMSSKAFDFYHNKKQFDSSLFYYQQIDQLFPNTRSAYINSRIGDCYLGLLDTANAELAYLKCLSIDRHLDSSGLSQFGTCFSLSGIYYNRKQFREALIYLDYTKTEYRPIRRMCQGMHGGYEGRLIFAYKKSLCYYGLNKKDSAISELAQIVFRPRWDVYLDSSDFEEIVTFFVNTVFEVFGATKAKLELQKAINNLSYIPSYEHSHNMLMLSVDCFITFAKTKINLDPGGGCQVYKRGEIPEFFSKDKLLEEFRDSPAYKYIMMGECQPATWIAGVMRD